MICKCLRPNPQAGGPTFVGYPLLLIQHIRSYTNKISSALTWASPKPEDHLLSAIRYFLFNTFEATLTKKVYPYLGLSQAELDHFQWLLHKSRLLFHDAGFSDASWRDSAAVDTLLLDNLLCFLHSRHCKLEAWSQAVQDGVMLILERLQTLNDRFGICHDLFLSHLRHSADILDLLPATIQDNA